MLATGHPIQNVDVLWRLRRELLASGVPVVFFYPRSAREMLDKVIDAEQAGWGAALSPEPADVLADIYQIDEMPLFQYIDCMSVLITSDYALLFPDTTYIKAKLVSLPHHASIFPPSIWSYDYDYIVSEKGEFSTFDYSSFPNQMKIHRNPSLTLLRAGHPKLDLIIEEREKAAPPPGLGLVLLIYPYVIGRAKLHGKGSSEAYVADWTQVISDFLAEHPAGLVVHRPKKADLNEPELLALKANFANESRVLWDVQSDNKYWLARADYFITDYSDGYINWCLTSLKPAIWFRPDYTASPIHRTNFSLIAQDPEQVLTALKMADSEKQLWKALLSRIRRREWPMLGRSFMILADMVKRIRENADDPMWLTMDKGNSPCATPADVLRIIGRVCSHPVRDVSDTYTLFSIWLPHFRFCCQATDPRVPLLLLKRGLSFILKLDTPAFGYGYHVNHCLELALSGVPYAWVRGTIRHCLRTRPLSAMFAFIAMACYGGMSGLQIQRVLSFLLMCGQKNIEVALDAFDKAIRNIDGTYSRHAFEVLRRELPALMAVREERDREGRLPNLVEKCLMPAPQP